MPDQLFRIASTRKVKLFPPKPQNKIVMPIPAVKSTTEQKLRNHLAVLQSQGITDLTALGKLPLSGNIIPQAGILVPPALGRPVVMKDLIDRPDLFKNTYRRKPGFNGAEVPLDKIGGTANVLKATRVQHRAAQPSRLPGRAVMSVPPPTLARNILSIPTAYWAADEINIADDTTIVIKQPHHWLVIIANKITIGTGVAIVWEQVDKSIPLTPTRKSKRGDPPTSTSMSGTDGIDGDAGTVGGDGYSGDAGPEVELWTLDINRLPSEILLFGQDGFAGGKGQPGQNGQDGARGRGFIKGSFPGTCKSGPGNGGDGGDGGRGGQGGQGGDGGQGGRFNLFAPPEKLNTTLAAGFYIDLTPGMSGPAGDGGDGGAGGSGGAAGNQRDGVGCPTDYGKKGSTGGTGRKGNPGYPGAVGGRFADAQAFIGIDAEVFTRTLNKPAIYNLSEESAHVDDRVTAFGKGFTHGDIIHVEGIPAQTTFVSDTILNFIVPSVEGGKQTSVSVSQVDGTESNNATITILPKIHYLEQNGKRSDSNPPPLFQPGAEVRIFGSGFSRNPSIKIDSQYVAEDSTNEFFVSPNELKFKLFRPSNVTEDAKGEPVEIALTLNDGSVATPVTILLDTLVILVFGDSIQWGQGLREDLKFHSIIADHLGQSGSIGVYKTVHAHSGAIIGVGNNQQMTVVDGEVPTSYPTILQQVDLYKGKRDLVDLVLLDGGINDIGVNDIINPLSTSDLEQLTRRYCFEHMRTMLQKVTQEFPNAKVIVTGYFQIVSDDSDLTALALLLTGLGLTLGGPLGGMISGGVSINMKNIMEFRCRQFVTLSNNFLQQAVDDVKRSRVSSGQKGELFLAKPNYSAANAIFASDAWLWGIEGDLGPADDYQLGGVEEDREKACDCVKSEDTNRTDGPRCKRASIGHPNKKGAEEYAKAIRSFL